MLVLADWQDAVRNWQIPARDDRVYTREGKCFGNINALDQRMWQVAAQDLAVEHTRKKDIVRKFRLARAFRACVDLAKGLADDLEVFHPGKMDIMDCVDIMDHVDIADSAYEE